MSRSLILQCVKCQRFTLTEACPACKGLAKNPLPAKYSPEDPYGEYRRRLKKLSRLEAGAKA